MQNLVWPRIFFFVAGEYFRQVERKIRKINWHEAGSFTLNFYFKMKCLQNYFIFDNIKFKD